jgi:hypothetical protein
MTNVAVPGSSCPATASRHIAIPAPSPHVIASATVPHPHLMGRRGSAIHSCPPFNVPPGYDIDGRYWLGGSLRFSDTTASKSRNATFWSSSIIFEACSSLSGEIDLR